MPRTSIDMNIETARKECERLYTLGFIAIPTISVFGRNDSAHVWCVRQLGFFTPPIEHVKEVVIEQPPIDWHCELDLADIVY